MVHQQKWYVVTVGKDPGVYSSWIEAGPKTKNIPGGSIHQSVHSEYEAIRMFEAAKARGEVRAYPDAGKKDKSTGKSGNALLSPLGEEAALLRTPLDLKGDAESTGLRTPFSSPARSQVDKLRRTLRDSTDPCSTSSSPPTKVTQYAPLYEEDDSPPNSPVARPPSPNFASTSRAYPDIVDGHLLETGIEETPFKLEVSDWGSSSPVPSLSGSHPGSEEHAPKPPRRTSRHLEPRSRSVGVEYRNLSDIADTESIDSRIWLPKSRVFDPDNVKPLPSTRPSSPAKMDTRFAPSNETVSSSSQRRCQIPLVDSPFVRADRGRYSRLTPNRSLPNLPDKELQDNCSSVHTDQESEKEVRDKPLTERLTKYVPGPRNDGRSHVQLVSCDGKDEQSVIMVHCPPNCPHETCYCRPLVLSVPAIESCRPTSSRYVDACVSPIITISSGRIQDTDSPVKIRSKRLDLDGERPCELAGFTHVSRRSIALESDVRSPIVKGTTVPINAAEMGRMRWKNTARARRLACITGLLVLSDLACFSVALALSILTHIFWALQNTVWTTVSSSMSF